MRNVKTASAVVYTQSKMTGKPLAGSTTTARTGAVRTVSNRVCEKCLGRGSISSSQVEPDEDGIEWQTQGETPCPDCNGTGEAKFDPEKDGDYDI